MSSPSASFKKRAPRDATTGKPLSLTAPVAKSVFEQRERLSVKSWGASGTVNFFASYLKRTSGASPSPSTSTKNECRPDMLQSLSTSQQSIGSSGGRSGGNRKGSCSRGCRGAFLLNRSSWMRSQRMRDSPLRTDRRKPTNLYLFYILLARAERVPV